MAYQALTPAPEQDAFSLPAPGTTRSGMKRRTPKPRRPAEFNPFASKTRPKVGRKRRRQLEPESESEAEEDPVEVSDGDSAIMTREDAEYVPRCVVPSPPPVQRRTSLRSTDGEGTVRRAVHETTLRQLDEVRADLERVRKERDKARKLAEEAMHTKPSAVVSEEDADTEPPALGGRPNGGSPNAGSVPPAAGAEKKTLSEGDMRKLGMRFVVPAETLAAGVSSARDINRLREQGYDDVVVAAVVQETLSIVKSGLLCLVRSLMDNMGSVSQDVSARMVAMCASRMGIPAHATPGPRFPLLVGEPGSGKSHLMAIIVRVVESVFGELATFMRLTVGLLDVKYSGVAEKSAQAALQYARTHTKTTTVGRVLGVLGAGVAAAMPVEIQEAHGRSIVIHAPVTLLCNDEVETIMPVKSNDSAKSAVCSTLVDELGRKFPGPVRREVVLLGGTNKPKDINDAMASRALRIPVLRPKTPAARKAAIECGMRLACPGWAAFPSVTVERLAMELFSLFGGDRRVVATLGRSVSTLAAQAGSSAGAVVPLSGADVLGDVVTGVMGVWASGGATPSSLVRGVDTMWSALGNAAAVDPVEEAKRRVAAVSEARYVMLIKERMKLADSFNAYAEVAGSRLWGGAPEVEPHEDDGL